MNKGEQFYCSLFFLYICIMKKVWCFSQYGFNQYMESQGWDDNNLPKDSAFISILSPEGSWGEEHYFQKPHDNVLNIRFEDINDYECSRGNGNVVKGLQDEQADIIFDFIDQHKGCDFYIHCAAGISRSQAVTRFIVDYYDDYNKESYRKENPCLYPNIHVLNLLRRRWMKKNYSENLAD